MKPLSVNFFPFGTQLRHWMLQERWELPVLTAENSAFSNPHTADASVLIAAYMRLTNESAEWALEGRVTNSLTAELRRIRFLSEFVLYTVRISEVLIKQLLFCSDFEPRDFERAALGRLLAQDCRACRKAKKETHQVSLLGSLAHRYGLCAGYNNCIEKDLPRLNHLRSKLTAHSRTWEVRLRTPEEARVQLHDETIEIGELFLHMLRHIGDIELAMRHEILGSITHLLSTPHAPIGPVD